MTKSGHPPLSVARHLGISSSTLRRWTRQFEEFLSEGNETAGMRHYTDADLETLTEIKRLLAEGLTVQQTHDVLQSIVAEAEEVQEAEPPLEEEPEAPEETDDLTADELTSLVGEIMDVEGTDITAVTDDTQVIDVGRLMAETLSSLSESQKMLLSGQQTERQLLGVLLQDNFNLKEENSRLRERMLEAERKLFELKRDVNEVQTTERERMRQMESGLFELQRRMDVLGGQRVSRQPAAPAPAKPAAAPASQQQSASPPAQSPAPAAPAQSPDPQKGLRWWQRILGK